MKGKSGTADESAYVYNSSTGKKDWRDIHETKKDENGVRRGVVKIKGRRYGVYYSQPRGGWMLGDLLS